MSAATPAWQSHWKQCADGSAGCQYNLTLHSCSQDRLGLQLLLWKLTKCQGVLSSWASVLFLWIKKKVALAKQERL